MDANDDLHRALATIFRRLRRGGPPTPLEWGLVGDVHASLGPHLDSHGEIHVRVGADAIHYRDDTLLSYSAREDKALYRLFQHGIRMLAFLPGITQQELFDLVDVLAAPDATLAETEEDLTILLGTRDLSHVHFVVVETFAEGLGSAQVRPIVEEACAVELGAPTDESPDAIQGDWLVRLGHAEARFFEEEDVRELARGLREDGRNAPWDADDHEIAGYAREMRAALHGSSEWIVDAAVSIASAVPDADADRLGRIVSAQIVADATRAGRVTDGSALRDLAQRLEACEDGTDAGQLAARLLSGSLEPLAFATLRAAGGGVRAAWDALRRLPAHRVENVLTRILDLPPSEARTGAIQALSEVGSLNARDALALLEKLDGSAAAALLHGFRVASLSDDALALFRAVASRRDLEVRVRAMSWFAYHGEAHAVAVLRDALSDDVPAVRTAALHLLVHVRSPVARALLKSWFDGNTFGALPFEEKRLGALLLSSVTGDSILPPMRSLAHERGLMKGKGHEERRAAAVAVLGARGDHESEDWIAKVAGSRGTGVLSTEAERVTQAWSDGRAPYDDPATLLDARVAELGIAQWLDASRPRSPSELPSGPPSSVMPASASPVVSGEVRVPRAAPVPNVSFALPPLSDVPQHDADRDSDAPGSDRPVPSSVPAPAAHSTHPPGPPKPARRSDTTRPPAPGGVERTRTPSGGTDKSRLEHLLREYVSYSDEPPPGDDE